MVCLNMDDISALVISGGDGTIHEVVNGMMMRDNKKEGKGQNLYYSLHPKTPLV